VTFSPRAATVPTAKKRGEGRVVVVTRFKVVLPIWISVALRPRLRGSASDGEPMKLSEENSTSYEQTKRRAYKHTEYMSHMSPASRSGESMSGLRIFLPRTRVVQEFVNPPDRGAHT